MLSRSFLITWPLLWPALVCAERADPPEFSAEEEAVFFDNALDKLVGERPEYGAPEEKVPAANSITSAGNSGANWADWIEADKLESEIKRQAARLAEATSTSARFNGGGYRQAGDALGLASVLMAVTAEHTGDPRWRDAAAGYRDLFAEGDGFEASEESYQQAKSRAADLTDLVRGSRPSTPEPVEEPDWSELAGRGGLMRRMATAHEEKLPDWLVDRRTLRRNADEIRHEAQVLAILSEAILRPGAYDAEDEEYQAPALELRRGAQDLEAAVKSNDPQAAQEAMRRIGQSCAECHEGYRG